MKRLALLFSFTLLATYAFASGLDKGCYKRCMERINDKKKCEVICTD
jgi:hypothetical protein